MSQINDLIVRKGQQTLENHPFVTVKGFFYRLARRLSWNIDSCQMGVSW
jgi:hypothetical protein